jgi:hypothetical protein
MNRDWLYSNYIEQGKSISAIARETGCAPKTVGIRLRDWDIPVRDRITASALSSSQKCPFNLAFFKSWSAPMAYTVGFAMADGNVEDNGKQRYLRLASVDRCVIDAIANAIDHRGNITTMRSTQFPNAAPCYSLKLCHAELPAIVAQYGLVPRKSLIAEMPDVPQEYLGHYVRGVLDGDGCVKWTNKGKLVRRPTAYFYSGSERFLLALSSALECMGMSHRPVIKMQCGNIFYFAYHSCDVVTRLYSLMYTGAGNLFLPRKRDRFREFFANVRDNMDAPMSKLNLPMETRREIVALLDL